MNIDKQLTDGADKLIDRAARTSDREPVMAIAQLLMAAAILAKTSAMSKQDFLQGVNHAMRDVFTDDQLH